MTATLLKMKEHPPQTTARRSSFYTAMRIMPARQRQAMYEIYAFCRAVDNIADDEGDPVQRMQWLNHWRRDLTLLYEGHPTPGLEGLATAVARYKLPREEFMAVIDGMEMDIKGPIQAPTWETLALYCDRVACAVGRLSVHVFGLGREEGLRLSHHLGLALQLTNILRDLDEDAAIGRLYLPRELLNEAGITSHDPAVVAQHPNLPKACEALAQQALTHFKEADFIMKACARRKVRAPRIMSRVYQSIHAALTRRGFQTPRQPVRLNKAKLSFILMRNAFF